MQACVAVRSLAFCALFTTAACTATISDNGLDHRGSDPLGVAFGGACGGANPSAGTNANVGAANTVGANAYAPERIRRLAPREVRNSIADALGLGDAFDLKLPDEYYPHQYDNRFDNLSVSVDFAQALEDGVQRAAAAAVKNLSKLVPCDMNSDEKRCFVAFLDMYGRRAFRRSLTADERQRFSDLFSQVRKSFDVSSSLAAVLEALFQSPDFVFRSEYGEASADKTTARLGADALATEMSYLLWSSGPDDQLLQSAEASSLTAPVARVELARKMLTDPRAKRGMRDFFEQWLELRAPNALQKGGASPDLVAAMLGEAERFVEIAATSRQPLGSLFTSTATVVDSNLAPLYGIAPPPAGSWSQVQLDPKLRAGFLTQPGFLAAHLPGNFSPIFLGLFVRRRLLCQDLPQPPADVPSLSKDPNVSTRERFAMHRNQPSCNACHSQMDPIGFAFERYDSLGHYHETETVAGKMIPLTGEGELLGTDVDGAVVGAVELGSRLGMSAEASSCFAANLLEFALGRASGASAVRAVPDADAIGSVASKAGEGIAEMLVQIVGTDAFAARTLAE